MLFKLLGVQAIVRACPLAVPLVVIPRASHCKLMEEPQLCVAHMAAFLDQIIASMIYSEP